MLIIAFYDGEYAGNCSFRGRSGSRRYKHRAGIGIALYQKFTGLGLGRLMLNVLLEEIRSHGFEQVELIVIGGNDRAKHLYESLGFREYGRLPDANRYDDGTSADDILMVLKFNEDK
jgi:ribosomal protein S18 acetylase RimI-like enzyme